MSPICGQPVINNESVIALVEPSYCGVTGDGADTRGTTITGVNDISRGRAARATGTPRPSKRAARNAQPTRGERLGMVDLDHAEQVRRNLDAAFGPMLRAAGDEAFDD